MQISCCVTESGMADKFTVMTSSSPLPSPGGNRLILTHVSESAAARL